MKSSYLKTSLLRLVILASIFAGLGNISAQPLIPQYDHVVVVIMENKNVGAILNNANAPYMNQLASNGALFRQSFGLIHPSQPNYLMLFSGSKQGVTNDAVPARAPFTTPNMAAYLLAASKTFVTYSEDLPSVGYNGESNGDYKRKHNPVTNWQGMGTNQVPESLNQPWTAFPSDYSQLPTVSYVVPNQMNDMHDGTIKMGDDWIKNNIDAYAQWALSHNSLLIVTFDESEDLANHIYTVFYGARVKVGKYYNKITHYNILRTLEDMYGLPYAGASANRKAITNCWQMEGISSYRIADKVMDFNIYPNPTNGNLTLKYFADNVSMGNISIYDISGKMVKDEPVSFQTGDNEIQLSLAGLSSGSYIINLKAGDKQMNKSFVLR